MDTLDNILEELDVAQVDYAEITVNGVELQVIQGMVRTLPRTRRLFLSGYARVEDGREPSNVRTVSFLREHGFQVTVSRRIRPTSVYDDPEAEAAWGTNMEGHVFAWRK